MHSASAKKERILQHCGFCIWQQSILQDALHLAALWPLYRAAVHLHVALHCMMACFWSVRVLAMTPVLLRTGEGKYATDRQLGLLFGYVD